MSDIRAVIIDSARGWALIAGVPVQISDAGTHGELHVGDGDGCVLRPLSFGQRWRVIRRAASQSISSESIATGLFHASLVGDPLPSLSPSDRLLAETLALHLAGAHEDAPNFAETLLIVGRNTGWSGAELTEMEAAEVDQLAMTLQRSGQAASLAQDDGWTTLRLAPPSSAEKAQADADPLASVLALRYSYVERLMQRANSTPAASASSSLEAEHEQFGSARFTALTALPSLINTDTAPAQSNMDTVPADPVASSINAAKVSPTDVPTEVNTTDRLPAHRVLGMTSNGSNLKSADRSTKEASKPNPMPITAWRVHTNFTRSSASAPRPVTQVDMRSEATARVMHQPVESAVRLPTKQPASNLPDTQRVSNVPTPNPPVNVTSSVPTVPPVSALPTISNPVQPPESLSPKAPSTPTPPSLSTMMELADVLANLLDDESTLRGLAR